METEGDRGRREGGRNRERERERESEGGRVKRTGARACAIACAIVAILIYLGGTLSSGESQLLQTAVVRGRVTRSCMTMSIPKSPRQTFMSGVR